MHIKEQASVGKNLINLVQKSRCPKGQLKDAVVVTVCVKHPKYLGWVYTTAKVHVPRLYASNLRPRSLIDSILEGLVSLARKSRVGGRAWMLDKYSSKIFGRNKTLAGKRRKIGCPPWYTGTDFVR